MVAPISYNQLGGGMNSARSASSMSGMSKASNMGSTSAPKTSVSAPSSGIKTAPAMSFQTMQAQSPQRGGAPMTLPSAGTITTESITAISTGRHKGGTLGAYQQGAISAMKASGRSLDFMAKNLNQATAMRLPNWNLPSDQAYKAGDMATSGRSQSFIRGKLGVSSDTPVPGKPG